ncbi:MAG: hypothetical protein M1822_002024 [Bathelium mastoideum]|nr:MAG: hypothetical protein M1822_002024 [Bathelium mastoideum]
MNDCDSDAENVAEYSVTFQRRQEDRISATLTAVTRAYSSLIFGVSRLTSTEGERSIHGSVIYSTVRMFKDILLLISDDAVRPHQHSSLCSIENRATRRSRNHIKAIRDNNMPNAIASFLTTALSALDSGSPSHREVFEGYLFVLLDRLGKILYLFTFGRSRAATIEEDLVDANLLDNDTIKEHAQVEASYLLKILERALDLGAQHLNDPSTSVGTATVGFKSSTKPTAAASRLPCPKKSVLSQRAKNRLQHTLINAVFGPSKDDDDRDFSDVLRLPAQCSALAKPSKVDERDISTRFTKELWTLLGWDILAKSDWQ